MIGARRTIGLALLGLLALGLRVWVVLAFSGTAAQPDESPAGRVAENLLAGRGFSLHCLGSEGPTSNEAPFYPLLLAAVYRCFGPASPQAILAVQLLQCVAGTVLVLIVAWLGWSLMPDRPSFGWVAAGVAAFYPPHVTLVAHLQVSVWAALALTLLLALVVSARWRESRRRAILAGCLAGLLLLMEPMLVLALPVCVVAFWLSDGDGTLRARLARAPLGRVALMAGIAVLVVAPWLVRNRLVHGRFTFVTSNFGYSLWQGNNPISGGAGQRGTVPFSLRENWDSPQPENWDSPVVPSQVEGDEVLLPPGGHRDWLGLSEPQRSRLLGRRAYEYICDHPARYGQLCLKRLHHFLLLFDAPSSRLEQVATVAWLVLALMGLSLSRSRWRWLWPSYAMFAASALFPVLVCGSGRFRTAVEPMTFLWASAAVAPLLVRLLSGRTIRVYRPGQQARDPLVEEHLLEGPHYDVSVRRRAG